MSGPLPPRELGSDPHGPFSILDAHVVGMFAVQKLSLTAKGIPSRGPLGTPKGKRTGAGMN